jgi:hypothetical protein
MELKLTAYVAFHSSIRGIDHLTDLLNENMLKKSVKLHRTKCSALLKNVISPALLGEVINELGTSGYSLILDESTDIATHKYMAVCIKFYSQKHCTMRTDYLGMFEVARTTSLDLYEGLKSFLSANKIDVTKIIGIRADGASNMVGAHNSLFTLLKRDVPTLELVKCVCHSIHLCSEKAIEELPGELDFLVRETYSWFSHSSLRQINYQAIYALINDGVKPLKIIAPARTRWLSFGECINRIMHQWIELQKHFEIAKTKEKCHTAQLLCDMYRDNTNYVYFVFLQPILKELNETNVFFQSEKAEIVKIHDNLKSLIMSVCSRILSPLWRNFLTENNWNTNMLENTLNNNLAFDQVDYGSNFECKLRELNIEVTEVVNIKTKCFNFLKRLAEELVQRLPTNVNSLQNLRYYSPNLCLSQIRPKINKLLFNYTGNISDLENQWRNLLTIEWSSISPSGIIPEDTIEFWTLVLNYKNAIGEKCFEKLAIQILNSLWLPFSNATVERVFSVMNAIKVKSRNRLSLKTLDAILRLRLYCYSRNICCKNFAITKDMLNLFTSQMYLSHITNNDETDVADNSELDPVIEFVNALM